MVISEADVEIIGANFELWDYGGKRKDPVPAFKATLKSADGGVHEQYYSVGNAADYTPSKDGKSLDILGDRERIHEQTNFAMFMTAFFKAGFPRNKINDDDIGSIVGTKGHVKQETVKRTGANITAESSILVFDKITGLPGESKSSGGGGGGSDSELDTVANSLVLEILSESGTIERNKLLPKLIRLAAFKELDKDVRTSVMNLVKTDEFILGSADWSVEDGVVSLGG
jgi:hypothetical protein